MADVERRRSVRGNRIDNARNGMAVAGVLIRAHIKLGVDIAVRMVGDPVETSAVQADTVQTALMLF